MSGPATAPLALSKNTLTLPKLLSESGAHLYHQNVKMSQKKNPTVQLPAASELPLRKQNLFKIL